MTNVLVVGVGNPDRGDDAVGPLVVRRLAGRVPPGVTLVERNGDVLALIDDWAGRDAVVLVDASAPGSMPGQVRRMKLAGDELPTDLAQASTHAFGVAEAVGLARALGMMPARVVVYAVEGENFAAGAPVSCAVSAAVDEVAARVVAELAGLRCGAAGEAVDA